MGAHELPEIALQLRIGQENDHEALATLVSSVNELITQTQTDQIMLLIYQFCNIIRFPLSRNVKV